MSTLTELQDLSITDLRKKAHELGLPLRRDSTKTDIIAMIRDVETAPIARPAMVTDDSSRPAKGFARIEIHKDPTPGASNSPVFVAVNSYQVLVQRGVKVDVPIKILRGALMTAKQEVLREDQTKPSSDPDRFIYEEVYAYPFTVYDIHEGEDPRGQLERAARTRARERRAFHAANKYWPNAQQLKEWLSSTRS